ncbi:hypothetical protein [Paraglaciecola marina]|uniref:hypothetical protein n=1 Tax=Paraglaciecola marina TaxID=2500157 RepID=UPI00105D655C|nr:hypothetical protein [Paraglaciecola marina]
MNNFKYFFLFISLVLLTALILVVIDSTIQYNHWILITLTTLSVTVIAFFIYLQWISTYSARVILIGDHYSYCEDLIKRCDNSLEGEHLRTQILPASLLETDSPRARYQLKTLKGSFFFPPRLVIAINFEQFFKANDAEKLILVTNLNRVLGLLKHNKRKQQIDLVFTQMQELSGYNEFSNQLNKSVPYSTSLPIIQQLKQNVNTTQALLDFTPSNFILFLKFRHNLSSLSTTIDGLISDLLLVSQKPKSLVYFFSL